MKKMLSTILALVLAVGMLMPISLHAQSQQEISVTIDGVAVDFEGQPPIIIDGRTLVPVRGVFEQLGFEVDWDHDAQMAILIRDDFTVRIIIGETTFGIDDYVREASGNVELDVPAQIIGDRTLLPIRAVLESVGYYVDWDNTTRTVMVSSTPIDGDYITIRGERFSAALTELELIDMDLQNEDIVVLRYMTNLTELWLTDNNISDLSPLAGLTNLTHLTIGWNPISDLSPLSGLENLTWLNIGGYEISDLSPLEGLVNLTNLLLHNNQISDISPLAGLVNLEVLWLGDNQVSDLTPLVGLVNLTELSLHRNEISDISPLAGLVNLSEIQLSANKIRDISPLAGLMNLERLTLWGNEISDISPLEGLDLEWLDLTDNPVEDWSYVEHLKEVVGKPE